MTALSSEDAQRLSAGRIRGAALREFLRWHEAQHPELAKGLSGRVLGQTASGVFQSGLPAFGILSSRWYDAVEIHKLLDIIGADTAHEVIAFEGGRAVMIKTLSGVFRAMMRFLVSPERYAANAHRIWLYYYDHGEFLVQHLDDGHAMTTVRGWHAHHRILCDMNVAAASVLYETIGCRNVVVRRTCCIDDGAEDCRYDITWAKCA